MKQNKQSLCGKIPAGLLPPPQLVTADPRRDALLGLLKHDSRKQNTGVRSLKAHDASPTVAQPLRKGTITPKSQRLEKASGSAFAKVLNFEVTVTYSGKVTLAGKVRLGNSQ